MGFTPLSPDQLGKTMKTSLPFAKKNSAQQQTSVTTIPVDRAPDVATDDPSQPFKFSQAIVNRRPFKAKKRAFPFSVPAHPKPKVQAKKKEKQSAEQLYLQLGTAVRSALASRMALRRIAQVLSDFDASKQAGFKSNQVQVLRGKLAEVHNHFAALEKMLMKFEFGTSKTEAGMVANATENAHIAMDSYRMMLEFHDTEDQDALMPLLRKLEEVTSALEKIKGEKISAVTAMEETFDKSRKAYWNEQTAANVKKANATRPVKQLKQPYPVNDVATPPIPLDPALIAEKAKSEIMRAEKAKKKEPLSEV